MSRDLHTMFGSVALAGVLLVTSGCLSSIFGEQDSKSEHYLVPEPGTGWSRTDPAEADVAYRNADDQAVLSLSSLCGADRYRALEELTADLLAQLPERTITEASAPITVDGHIGLVTEAQGAIDGHPLTVRIAVVRTPRCVYDLLLAGGSLTASSREGFDQILQGFREKAAR